MDEDATLPHRGRARAGRAVDGRLRRGTSWRWGQGDADQPDARSRLHFAQTFFVMASGDNWTVHEDPQFGR